MATLAGKTLFITGASRGIGLAIALRAARDGANIAIAAKTAEPTPEAGGHHLHGGQGDRGSRRQGPADRVRHPLRGSGAGGRRQDGRDLRRPRHLRQQRQRHLAHPHHGDRHEALRPDARHQRARHVPGLQDLHPASQEGGQPAHPDAVAAARHERALVRPARRLLDGQVQHEHHRARPVRRAEGGRHRRQHAVAAHHHRHGGDQEPARRRRPDAAQPLARDHGRCRACHLHAGRQDLHRPLLHRRHAALRARRARLREVPRRSLGGAGARLLRAGVLSDRRPASPSARASGSLSSRSRRRASGE